MAHHGLWPVGADGDAHDRTTESILYLPTAVLPDLTHVISCDTQWFFSTPNQPQRTGTRLRTRRDGAYPFTYTITPRHHSAFNPPGRRWSARTQQAADPLENPPRSTRATGSGRTPRPPPSELEACPAARQAHATTHTSLP
eukprot:3406403-Prymnesium_polylepis.1